LITRDKNERVDNVFRSEGNKYTITEIIKNVDDDKHEKASTFDPDDDSDDEHRVIL